MTAAEQAQITQADRDAVYELCKQGGVFKGSSSFPPAYEAFARHRHTATAEALKAAAVEFNKLTAIAVSDARRSATAEALEAAAKIADTIASNNYSLHNSRGQQAAEQIAAAIRAAIAKIEGDTK